MYLEFFKRVDIKLVELNIDVSSRETYFST